MNGKEVENYFEDKVELIGHITNNSQETREHIDGLDTYIKKRKKESRPRNICFWYGFNGNTDNSKEKFNSAKRSNRGKENRKET